MYLHLSRVDGHPAVAETTDIQAPDAASARRAVAIKVLAKAAAAGMSEADLEDLAAHLFDSAETSHPAGQSNRDGLQGQVRCLRAWLRRLDEILRQGSSGAAEVAIKMALAGAAAPRHLIDEDGA